MSPLEFATKALAGIDRRVAAQSVTATPDVMRKIVSPIVKHKHEGKTEAPKTVLYDEYGVPMPNADQLKTDIHGRTLQPDSDPDMPYQPNVGDEEFEQERREMQRGRLVRRAFTQDEVDLVRHRVRLNWGRTVVIQNIRPVPMKHLWWPTPGDIGTYELRDGNPPADADRPLHLRGLKLHIDCRDMPSNARSMLAHGGRLEQLVDQRMEAAGNPKVSSALVLQGTLRVLAEEMHKRGFESWPL